MDEAGGSATGNGGEGSTSANVIDVTKENFQEIVNGSDTRPTIIDCYADWCGPCRQLTPALVSAVEAAGGKLLLAKVNTDEQPELAQALNVTSLPTVYGLSGRKVVSSFVGVPDPQKFKNFMDDMVALASTGPAGGDGGNGTSVEDDLAGALRLLMETDDHAAAEAAFKAILERPDVAEADAAAVRALTGVLTCAVAAGDLEKAKLYLAAIENPEAAYAEHVQLPDVQRSLATAKLMMGASGAMQAGAGGEGATGGASVDEGGETTTTAATADPVAELQRRVSEDPQDVEALHGLALAHVSAQEFSSAIDACLQIVKVDNSWNEGAGKALLFQIFESLGPQSKLTIDGRRRLTNLLM